MTLISIVLCFLHAIDPELASFLFLLVILSARHLLARKEKKQVVVGCRNLSKVGLFAWKTFHVHLRKGLDCFTKAASTIPPPPSPFPPVVTRTVYYILLLASFWDWGFITSQLVAILLDDIQRFKYAMNRLQLVPYFDFLKPVWFDTSLFLSLYFVANLIQVRLRCPCNTNWPISIY